MKPNAPLDYAVFQLSPKRSHCELLISSNGSIEKLASGLVKPFVTHLKIAEEQVAQAVNSVKLEAERCRNWETWFTKGTVERFVRFVSTPEVLETVNAFDEEMSQLEAARRIYSQASDNQLSGGGDRAGAFSGADATKKELLRAIDVRLTALKQDLGTACSRASAAGFNCDTVSELRLFADCFGANRLNEACTKFISLCHRRLDLMNACKPPVEEQLVRASWESDMSIDDPVEGISGSEDMRPHQPIIQRKQPQQQAVQELQRQLVDIQAQLHPSQSKSPLCNQFDSTVPTEEKSINNENKKEEAKKEEAVVVSLHGQASQPARRLSVQDRINLFENKQKENSGGKPAAVGKSAELRRLPSDVSSAPAVEKTVLRRWSGASDMSIDLGNDKRETNRTESPLCTPSSTCQTRSNAFPGSLEDVKDHKVLSEDTVSSVKVEGKSVSGLKDQGELDGGVVKEKDLKSEGKVGTKEQGGSHAKVNKISGTGEWDVVDDQDTLESKLKHRDEAKGLKDQERIEGHLRALPKIVNAATVENTVASCPQIKNALSRLENHESGKRAEDTEVRDQGPSLLQLRGLHGRSRSSSGQFESSLGVKYKDVTRKGAEDDQFSQKQSRLVSREVEPVASKEIILSGEEEMLISGSEVPRMNIKKPLSAGPEQSRKLQFRAEESSSSRSNKLGLSDKKVIEIPEGVDSVQTPSVEQAQRVRQSKGNQELNDELKMKAHELEKLFAKHKLRNPGDQSGSSRRSNPVEMRAEPMVNSHHTKPVSVEKTPMQSQDRKTVLEPVGNAGEMFTFSTPPMKTVDHQDSSSSLRENFSELSFSDDSKGKFYEMYMQKRDAKLREEWGTKKAEKEAKLKALQDSLERSKAEMKAKLSESAGRRNASSISRQRVEKLRSLSSHSGMKREKPIDSLQSEEEGDFSEFPELKAYGQDKSLGEASLGDGASRNLQNKKHVANRNSSSSTPRTTTAPVPRSSAKISYAGPGRRRVQSDNPLAQSVPNFSDLRKENTKPSSAIGKATNRLPRTYARSKSSNEEISAVKEEKPRRSQALRKSTSGPIEYKDPLDSDSVSAPSKFDKEQMELGNNDRLSRNVESKSFLRKGSGIGPGRGASILKWKALLASEVVTNEEESEFSHAEADDFVDLTEGEDELETSDVEDHADVDNSKSRPSHKSEKLAMSGSENDDSLRSVSQVDHSLVAELPASVASTFQVVGSRQDSPVESPVSWNSRLHHPFSYPHDNSDIDAYVDSPTRSPASWNSHALTQTEAEAARMRKKWGSTHMPVIVLNSSHNQGRKDMTKGFKRLLKFGRKSRGTESLVDWISATTSEGDDDTEDGRDPANRSSEDLRKSRMGYSHPPDDGFNDSELFNEQVQALQSSIPVPPANFKLRDDHMSGSSIKAPRSFFSLSSFRSKGSDSKPR